MATPEERALEHKMLVRRLAELQLEGLSDENRVIVNETMSRIHAVLASVPSELHAAVFSLVVQTL